MDYETEVRKIWRHYDLTARHDYTNLVDQLRLLKETGRGTGILIDCYVGLLSRSW
ncbi:MAG: hypothetical protein HY349_07735 [Nitrospirae bacterium]|nr:hypothetical protein [Nitrospirota bacterium]